MEKKSETCPETVRTQYKCLVGHVISPGRFELDAEWATFDNGALVRLCAQHGAPMSVVSEHEVPS